MGLVSVVRGATSIFYRPPDYSHLNLFRYEDHNRVKVNLIQVTNMSPSNVAGFVAAHSLLIPDKDLIVDFSDVTYADSTGVSEITYLRRMRHELGIIAAETGINARGRLCSVGKCLTSNLQLANLPSRPESGFFHCETLEEAYILLYGRSTAA